VVAFSVMVVANNRNLPGVCQEHGQNPVPSAFQNVAGKTGKGRIPFEDSQMVY
jgi:hypothetical protein